MEQVVLLEHQDLLEPVVYLVVLAPQVQVDLQEHLQHFQKQ